MESEVCISELLCFLKYNGDKLVASELKSTLVGFYNDDEFMKAKETLLNALTKVQKDRASEVPRLLKRTGDNNNKTDVIHTADRVHSHPVNDGHGQFAVCMVLSTAMHTAGSTRQPSPCDAHRRPCAVSYTHLTLPTNREV